ncbi:MAG: hypothetical protein FJW40_21265 [Acidobacteria bacterium]|nr:hypothetical protein [Acidobacteriota bacterium]
MKGSLNEQELADIDTVVKALSQATAAAQSGNAAGAGEALAALTSDTLSTVSDLRYRFDSRQQTQVTTRDTRVKIVRPLPARAPAKITAPDTSPAPAPAPTIASLPGQTSEEPQVPAPSPDTAQRTLLALA